MVQQMEIMGQPFSQGEAGQGVRLLLGSDVAPYANYAPGNRDDLNNQTLMAASFPTRWLLPASPGEFDPRCVSSNVTEAHAANCSLVGSWQSCTTGCDLDPAQEAIWAGLPRSILGLPKDMWTVADGAVWDGVRGMLTGFSYFRNETGAADTFVLMETSPSSSYALPFANFSDRPWWIVNQSAAVAMTDLTYGFRGLPIFKMFELGDIVPWFTNGREEKMECRVDSCVSPSNVFDGNCDVTYGDTTPFPFRLHDMQFQAQCFAASDPNPAGNSSAAGQVD